MLLILDESELIKSLPVDTLQRAISAGKGYKRVAASMKRQSQGFDRWLLYEVLKGNRYIDDSILEAVEIMPAAEVRYGVIEFLSRQRRKRQYVR